MQTTSNSAVYGNVSEDRKAKDYLSCPVCLSSFSRKKHNQEFCSDKCRITSWAAHRFLKEFKAGKADGLKNIIQELSEAAKR
jgi:endogenous inhibitor of DNA gyrase (YacG/DUF329 family)